MVAKAGLGLIGLSAIGVGGVALAKPHLLGMDYMPSYKSLSTVSSYTQNYGDGKFGNKHGKYWISNEKANKAWWEWSFRRLQEDKDKVNNGAFAFNTKVDSGFKEGNAVENKPKALNQVCDAAYKAANGKVKANGTGSDEFNEEHVWKYCSPFGGKLKTVKDVDNKTDQQNKYGEGKIGKTKESELISATGSENNKFWEIREKEFKDTGDKSLTHNDNDSYFVKNKEGKTIKELCEYVYGQQESTSGSEGKIQTTTAVKYCALSSSTGDA